MVAISIDVWQDSFAVAYGCVSELLAVLPVDGVGAWYEVGSRPDGEYPGGGGGSYDGKARPLHQLAEVVGAGDHSV